MKRTKELLMLALPLAIAGCNGSTADLTTPSGGIDPEGIFQGQAGNGDTLLGIVTADGTADFLEFQGSLASLTQATPFIVIAPASGQALLPDTNGNYSFTYDGYSGNNYTLPSGDANETGTFSGLADTSQSTLSGNYTVTGAISSGVNLSPQDATSVNYSVVYQPSYYEAPSSSSIISGFYQGYLVVGVQQIPVSFTISPGASDSEANVVGYDTASLGCNFTGTVTTPDTDFNAYDFSITTSGCVIAPTSLSGLGTLLTVNSVPTAFGILSDTTSSTAGALLVLQLANT